MALRRYARTTILGVNKYYGTSRTIQVIREGIANGAIDFTESFLHEGERLDTIAGRVYGDSSLWWIIAAASGIGWMFQVPPGTLLKIPKKEDVSKLVG